ncbi:MAG: hypothetical protein EBT92_16560 [Planctomycetes bacterium]|nr:hypothetical protein [Planctomycetota bacterium]NBY01974.1 hypothetical protein [Planctomycetota bacterium]
MLIVANANNQNEPSAVCCEIKPSLMKTRLNQPNCHYKSCVYLKAYGIGLILHYCYKNLSNHYLE